MITSAGPPLPRTAGGPAGPFEWVCEPLWWNIPTLPAGLSVQQQRSWWRCGESNPGPRKLHGFLVHMRSWSDLRPAGFEVFPSVRLSVLSPAIGDTPSGQARVVDTFRLLELLTGQRRLPKQQPEVHCCRWQLCLHPFDQGSSDTSARTQKTLRHPRRNQITPEDAKTRLPGQASVLLPTATSVNRKVKDRDAREHPVATNEEAWIPHRPGPRACSSTA